MLNIVLRKISDKKNRRYLAVLLLIIAGLLFSACPNELVDPEQGSPGGTGDPGSSDASYTVTFDSQGGSAVAPATSSFGYITEPNPPARTYWTFMGWYTNSQKTQVFDFDNQNITAAMTLYAKWRLNISEMEGMPASTSRTMLRYDLHEQTPPPTDSFTVGDFKILRTEVHQDLWNSIMGESTNPSYFKSDNWGTADDDKYMPVDSVSWYHTLVFCNTASIYSELTPVYSINGKTNPADWGAVPTTADASWDAVKVNLTASGYRLPTSDEWEYAARDGNYIEIDSGAWDKDHYYSGHFFANMGSWYQENSGGTPHPVGPNYQRDPSLPPIGEGIDDSDRREKSPSPIILYDMSGNLWEWVWDKSSAAGSDRLRRGGSFEDSSQGTIEGWGPDAKDYGSSLSVHLPASRSYGNPGSGHRATGFRIVQNIPAVPPAPAGLTAVGNKEKLTASWKAVSGAESYEVYYSTENVSGGATKAAGSLTSTSYTITGLTSGTTYYVWVKAVNSRGSSAFSTPANAVTPALPPLAPAAPTPAAGNTEVELSWSEVSGASSYEVWYHTANDSSAAVKTDTDVSGLSATLTGLTNDTPYFFWIKAKNDNGTSSFSPAAAATPRGISSQILAEGHYQFARRCAFASVVFDGKIHLNGGATHGYGTSASGHDVSSNGTAWALINHGGTYGMMLHHMVVFQDKLWVVGRLREHGVRWIKGTWSRTADGVWTHVDNSPPWGDANPHGAVVLNNRLYVVVNEYEIGGLYAKTYSSSDGKTWTEHFSADTAKRIPALQQGAEVVAFGGKIWFIGGYNHPSPDKIHSDEIWSTADGIDWTMEGTLPISRYYHSIVEHNGKLWMLNGSTAAASHTKDVFSSTDGINWIPYTGNVNWAPRHAAEAVSFDGSIWIIGGDIRLFVQTNDIWRFNPE